MEKPSVTITAAFEIYVREIAAPDLADKSAGQKNSWLKVKRRALTNFVRLVGDKPIGEITREDALKIYRFWQQRIAPPDDEDANPVAATHASTSGNRDIGNMRLLYRTYHEHLNVAVDKNPFDNLHFSDDDESQRPPFEVEWIVSRILVPGALETLNGEARAIVLGLVETGARPSELANLEPEDICIHLATPFISIRKFGQKAGVIDVGVGEKDSVDLRRVERKWPVVELFLGFRTLEHAAIDQYSRGPGLQQKTGAGDRTRSTMKGYFEICRVPPVSF
ncbi:integrase [Rhizobium leguminosarum]|nr:integrase [Rhizobium leguminosarum]